ncbi:MAG: L,D-transpeptidase [Bacteriovoracaceae bacterium]|nr:L,D-transpeptidase [Bacteriovoracaceae bacterium]
MKTLIIFILMISQSFAEEKLQRKFFAPYEDVIERLHADVENETELVYLVNTGTKNCGGTVPAQHLQLLKKSEASPIFTRNSMGEITGLSSETLVASLPIENGVIQHGQPAWKRSHELQGHQQFIPISSGIPRGNMILTYSGIFRVNERRTNDMRRSTNTDNDPMQNSVYINGEYDEGNEARLALHGTATRFWPLLGKQRASSGCIRLHSDFSRWNQNLLFSKSSAGELIPRAEWFDLIQNWNRRLHYPPREGEFSTLPRAKKIKALIVFFDGYSKCAN